MDAYLADWLTALLRVVHVIAGIAWVGASFYFVWLDSSLDPPPEWKARRGVAGDLWAIHGGGIYEVAKYRLGPEALPRRLHWFKWEAYSTWLSGSALLVVLYYLRAQTYLVGPDTWLDESGAAIGASMGYLVGGWIAYEALVRSPLSRSGALFAAVMVAVVAAMSWLAFGLFSPRAAFVHLGAFMATIMTANVFVGIIPAQKAFVRDVERGAEPDAARAAFAKLRSTHNNYFTFPVVICMVSNHSPFLYGQSWSWLLLVGLCGLSAVANHFMNLRNRGQLRPALLLGPLAALVAIAVGMSWHQVRGSAERTAVGVPAARALAIVAERCSVCHAEKPSFAGIATAPAGIRLESLDDVRRAAPVVRSALLNRYMPLGNVTQLTADERSELLAWLASLDPSS